MHHFQLGRTYHRVQDIHAKYGGQRQGGISTPAKHPFIFLFTGTTGNAFGYNDYYSSDDVFQYTGEGQIGDMKMDRGNKSIQDHEENEKRLLMFELTKGGVRFSGEFALIGHRREQRPDRNGDTRSAIIFELEQLSNVVHPGNQDATSDLPSHPKEALRALYKKSLSELRALAIRHTPKVQNRVTKLVNLRLRSEAVRAYAHKRASGVCECCEQVAPFRTKRGAPYLEPHHLFRLADGGPDEPENVAACCPTCHRKIHHGEDGDSLNQMLIEKIRKKEKELSELK